MFAKKMVWITAFALLLAPSAAFADIILDFSVEIGGSITYNGTLTGTLNGSGMPVSQVTGFESPLNQGNSLTISYGVMSFTSGPFDLASDSSHWNFHGGASTSVTITGCIAGITSLTCTGLNNVALMTGTFLDGIGFEPQVDYGGPGVGANGMIGSFTDTKNAAMLAYFGAPGGTYTGAISPEGLNPNSANPCVGILCTHSAISADGAGGDTLNSLSTVPEPASLTLLGTGLLGIAGFVRRKLFS